MGSVRPVLCWLMVVVAVPLGALDWLGTAGAVLLHDHDHEGPHLHPLDQRIAFGHHNHPDSTSGLRDPDGPALVLRLPDLTPVGFPKTRLITLHLSPLQWVAPPLSGIPNPQEDLPFPALRESLARIHGPPQDLVGAGTLLLI